MTDHRQLAVDLFNHTRSIFSTKNRTAEQDEEMAHTAHVSRYPLDLAFANKRLARVLVSNDQQQAEVHLAEARQIGEQIEKDEDRTWLHTNLDEIASMFDAD